MGYAEADGEARDLEVLWVGLCSTAPVQLGGCISRDGDMDVDSGDAVKVRVGGPPLRP